MSWKPHLRSHRRVVVLLVNILAFAFTLAPAVSAVKRNPPYITALGAIGAILSLGSSILASSRSSAQLHPREAASSGTGVTEAQTSADLENHLQRTRLPKRQLEQILALDSGCRTSFRMSNMPSRSHLDVCIEEGHLHDCFATDLQRQTATPENSGLLSFSTESLHSSTHASSCSSFYHSFSPPSSILTSSAPLSTLPPSLLSPAPSIESPRASTELTFRTSSETYLPPVALSSSSLPLPPPFESPSLLTVDVSSTTSHSMGRWTKAEAN
ncbi:hypothetical protein F5879DRAFT_1068595 [Lentinula edodes]|nr:hypothetical protein F5879DRAFT_1068595 [Lentinula edodes]